MTVKAEIKKKGSQTDKSLRHICGLNGFTVSQLAAHVLRSRQAVFYAWRNPDDYPITWDLINRALPRRKA